LANTTNTTAKTKVWGIQTKFETPILDFGFATNVYTNDRDKTIGMWHQYGNLPTGSNGIYMQITDLPRDYILSGSESDVATTITGRNLNLTGSLTDIVGFSKDPIKLGKVAPSKTIKEAIVAIPYYNEGNERKYFFFNDLVKEYVEFLKSDLANVKSFDRLKDIPQSITKQIETMSEYVLPPPINFMKNQIQNPFFMYIFEFSYTLSQQDLVDIWQGLMPSIALNFDEQSTSITHSLDIEDTLTELEMKDKLANIQWLTFKVKYKAKNNYKSKIFKSIKNTNNKKAVKDSQFTKTRISSFDNFEELDYSYNWPYDYFSMIEAAKIVAQVDFIDSDRVTQQLDKIENPIKSLNKNVIENAQSTTQIATTNVLATQELSQNAINENTIAQNNVQVSENIINTPNVQVSLNQTTNNVQTTATAINSPVLTNTILRRT
jgi:hypothetical protein